MSIEDLMFPRYKVVGDFWDNPFEMGTILTFNNLKEPFMPPLEELESGNITKYLFTDFLKCKGGSTMYCIKRFEGYPHLFQKLEWWEGRDETELPEYVKIPTGEVFKVADKSQNNRRWHVDNEIEVRFISNSHYTPATEEEYNTYITQQK